MASFKFFVCLLSLHRSARSSTLTPRHLLWLRFRLAFSWEQAATLAAAVEDVEKRLSKDVEDAKAKAEEVKVCSAAEKKVALPRSRRARC